MTASSVSLPHNFFNDPIIQLVIATFHTLTYSQKDLFRKLLELYQKYGRDPFTSVKYLANEIGRSERTVKRGTKLFKELGLIFKKPRAYTTTIYMFEDIFMFMDLDKIDEWRIKLLNKQFSNSPRSGPQNGPISNIYLNTYKGTSSEGAAHKCANDKKPFKKEPDLPNILKKIPIPKSEKLSIASYFSEAVITNACLDRDWYLDQGKKIYDELKFLKKQLWFHKKRIR